MVERSVTPLGVCLWKDGMPPNVNIKYRINQKKYFKSKRITNKNGTVLTTYTGGGGGFEEPLERKPDDVLKDVKNRYVSIEKAKEDYKVVITKSLKLITKQQKN